MTIHVEDRLGNPLRASIQFANTSNVTNSSGNFIESLEAGREYHAIITCTGYRSVEAYFIATAETKTVQLDALFV